MPEYGRLTEAQLPFTTPFIAPLYPAPPWKLEDSRILLMSFEIDKQIAETWLPPALSRSYPPYGHIMVSHYPSSPVGPFTAATQLVVCRWRMAARAYPLLTVVDNEAACAAFREFWGFPAKLGRVSLEQDADGVTATVERPAGRRLAAIRMTELEEITAGELRFDPMMNPRLVRTAKDGEPPQVLELDQIDPTYAYKESWRGRATLEYPDASEGDPWHLMQNRNFIAATYVICDTELGYARFVEPYSTP